MEYKFITYNTMTKPSTNGAVCSISFTEENTRNRVIATLKTHGQVRELIEQLQLFSHPSEEKADEA